MKTQELFNVLEQNNDKSLLFEYAPNLLVGANYHITEVKHVAIDAVDCGSQTDAWKETIIQLWESPNEIGKTEYMSVYKAMAILKKVGKMKPYTLDAEVKFEYSNVTFNTAQLFVDSKMGADSGASDRTSAGWVGCAALDSAWARITKTKPYLYNQYCL